MTSCDAAGNNQLVVGLRRAAGHLFDQRTGRDLEHALDQIVMAAVDMVPGAAGGGISRTEAGTVRSSHATTDTIGDLDREQSRLGEGPCITAADHPPEDGVIYARDLDSEADRKRWPRFASAAVHRGYRSLLSTNLLAHPKGPHSALNLYGAAPHTFDDTARTTAAVFAVQAATLIYGVDQARQLNLALESRDTIGQAKGVLMERFTIDSAEAFQMLVSSSQDTNTKLVEVAGWLVAEAERRRHGPEPSEERR